jgi:hypothetical protein
MGYYRRLFLHNYGDIIEIYAIKYEIKLPTLKLSVGPVCNIYNKSIHKYLHTDKFINIII